MYNAGVSMADKNRFKVVSLNFLKKKHKKLLQRIYDEADDREMSVSAFCISILKYYIANIEKQDETDRNNI